MTQWRVDALLAWTEPEPDVYDSAARAIAEASYHMITHYGVNAFEWYIDDGSWYCLANSPTEQVNNPALLAWRVTGLGEVAR